MSREVDAGLHFLFLTGAIALWIIGRKKDEARYIDICGLYLLFTFMFDGLAVTIMLNRYLAEKLISNLFLYHFLNPIQLILILMLYREVIVHTTYKKLALWLSGVLLGISILISIFVQPINSYPTYIVLIKHAVTIPIVLIFFYQTLASAPYSKINIQPIFWFSIGFLFHSAFNILMEGFSNYLGTYANRNYQAIYLLHTLSNYCLFILIGIGLSFFNHRNTSQ